MIVLGLDTATPATAIGLLLSDGSILEARDDPGPGERPGHATRLLPLAHELLAEAGLRPGEVGRIAVGVGPGTFTGLRIGVASARGLAQSSGAELAGVSSLRALALGAGHDPVSGRVLAMIDARRGEVFLAAYLSGGPEEKPEEVLPARACVPARLGEVIAKEEGKGESWVAVGDGALLCRDQLEALGARVAPEGDRAHRVSGAAICRLGALAAPARAPEEVVPDYLRRPDAELARKRAPGADAPGAVADRLATTSGTAG